LAGARNYTTDGVWVALTGTNQHIYLGVWQIDSTLDSPDPENFWWGQLLSDTESDGYFTDVGEHFLGRPVIVPDPTGKTGRTYFFAVGRDGDIYWKYHDGSEGGPGAIDSFHPAGRAWAGPLKTHG
jgi:hypothetical protein